MGIKREEAISCKGGFSAHVKRGEGKIFEMECHLKCLREKLNILETMLPSSTNNFTNRENENIQKGCTNLDTKKSVEQVCVLQSLATKEKKLREEIFNMECKEKKYLQALSQVNIQQGNKEEIEKVQENHDFTSTDYSPRNRKGESVKKEKISRLEEYSKKLCDCLKSIQNNRKEWSQQAGYLSKEFNCYENYPGLKDLFGNFNSEEPEKGNDCPCGEPMKCNSCIVCTCSDWEQDLKIDAEEKAESQELTQKEENLVKKKSDCKCFQSSSDSNHSSKSLEIRNIYRCSLSKMQSEMSIETPSIPSTVDNVITGSEVDKKNYCCLCRPEEDQKCCEICQWDREFKRNRQLYPNQEKCHLCEICDEERFRGGTDFGMTINKRSHYGNLKKNFTNVLKSLTPRQEKNVEEKVFNNFGKMISSTHASQLSKNLEIEELKRSLQDLENKNNVLRRWIKDQSDQIKKNPVKDEIIAALVDEIRHDKNLIVSKIWKSQKKKRLGILTKDLGVGLFILLLTFSSYFLGFSGISSLSLILKTFFQLLIIPSQTCSQIYQKFPLLCEDFKNVIFDYSEMIFNFLQKMITNAKNNFESALILNYIFALFALISTLFALQTVVKFLFKTESCGLKIIILPCAKLIICFIRPVMFSVIFVKFVLLFSLTRFSNLISFCITQKIRNFSYRVMNSSIDILLIFKNKSSFLCTSNIVCIILGFLLNKMSREIKVDLDNLRVFVINILGYTPEENKTKNSPDNWINLSNFLSPLNTIVTNIFESLKVIYQSFEIK